MLDTSIKYFVPCRNIWLKRFIVLLGFIMFDYAATLTFCNTPTQEANIFARAFMKTFGKEFGLTMFNAITTVPLYLIFSVDSHLVKFPPKIARAIDPIVDIIFAWFIAGARFNGATSWFWNPQPIIRQIVGATTYLMFIYLSKIPKYVSQFSIQTMEDR